MWNALRRIHAMWYPNRYHGWGLEKNYFEGWYFKLVDPTEQHVMAIIPGIAMNEQGNKHAFIQVFDGKNCQATYHEFPAEAFLPAADRFHVAIENNSFSADHIHLNLPELRGELSFHQLTRWPKLWGAPGIMGWYSFVPFMECYHGVVSLHHGLKGQLMIKGHPVNFDGGTGYTEKDWGRSFPSAWIWMQSHHFGTEQKVSLMGSVAHIPWLNSHFTGHIVGLQIGNRLFRFATYTGSSLQATLGQHEVELIFTSKQQRLVITAKQAPGATLISPLSGEMRGKVNESMQATLAVQVYENGKLFFEGIGKNAGLEIAGQVDELFD